MTTDRMMRDVLIALVPVLIIAGWNAHQFLVYQLAICIAGCVAAEAIWTALRRQPLRIGDCSAVVTGAILALSMPWSSPWYVSLIGAVAAIARGVSVRRAAMFVDLHAGLDERLTTAAELALAADNTPAGVGP